MTQETSKRVNVFAVVLIPVESIDSGAEGNPQVLGWSVRAYKKWDYLV